MKRKGNILIAVLLLILAACAYFIFSGSSGGDPDAKYNGRIVHRLMRDKTIVFFLELTDESGKQVKVIKTSGGRRMKPPKVELLDEKGNKVHTFQLKYG